jgi:hypothetical protein
VPIPILPPDSYIIELFKVEAELNLATYPEDPERLALDP